MYIYAKQKFCRFLTVSRKKRTNHTVQESLLLSNHILLILVRFHKSKQNRQVSSPFPAGSVCLEVFILSERYYTASAYYLSKFGRPVQKAVLDIGCTCPNIDGTISSGGCLFCDGGSGHFTHPGTVTWQLEQERQRIRASVPDARADRLFPGTYQHLREFGIFAPLLSGGARTAGCGRDFHWNKTGLPAGGDFVSAGRDRRENFSYRGIGLANSA